MYIYIYTHTQPSVETNWALVVVSLSLATQASFVTKPSKTITQETADSGSKKQDNQSGLRTTASKNESIK